MKRKNNFTPLKKLLNCHSRFLVTTHINVEPDALGSELAFAGLLKKLGKRVLIVNDEAAPARYRFMPGVEHIISGVKRVIKSDAIVILDASDLNRIGKVRSCLDKNASIINIDHHISNTNFGHCNIVDSDASSACEIVYDIFSALNVKLDRGTALNLYCGIITDTGSFHYSNTTSKTFSVVSHLLEFGLDVNKIYRDVYKIEEISHAHLIGSLLQDAKTAFNGQVVYLSLSKGVTASEAIDRDLAEEALNILRLISGGKIFIIFRVLPGSKSVRLNLRSHCQVDVNKIAQSFKGGGHMTAAGATVKGSLISVREAVFKELKRYL
jgi:phosphoesterase RecJ-like protein